MKKTIIFLLFSSICFSAIYAQSELNKSSLRTYLSADSTSYAGVLFVNQIWTRYIQNNPDINGVNQYPDMDIALRRSRIVLYSWLMDRVFIYTQLGLDGQTYRSGKKPGLNAYNAQTEFIVKKNKLHIGFGLNTWNGVSRYNNSKLLEFLVVDNPAFVYPVGGTFAQFGRQFGIYAKGRLNDFHYQLILAKPFEYGTSEISSPKTTERINENMAVKGYFQWQFLDNEDHLFPYMTLNNLGRKRILNFGAGFYYQPEAMLVEAEKDISTVDPLLAAMLIGAGQEDKLPQFADYFPSKISDIFLAAADVFLDIPTAKHGSITSYLGYYYYFFGPNYLRSGGKLNVSRMDASLAIDQGIGNAEWEIGTGQIIRGEFGYMLPGEGMKNRIQPYGAFTWKDFEALDQASVQFDVGVNWLMYGHNLKWTLQYSNRPIYNRVDGLNKISSYKGQVILQTQVYF